MEGYVKLYRKLLDNPVVCKDADHLAVWLYLLLNATHTAIPALFGGQKITLMPGQLITGRQAISRQFGISESKTKRILIAFESDQQIDRQRGNKNSLITIKNWDLYQDSDQQNDQPVTSKRPASDQQVTTNKNVRMKECKKLEKESIPYGIPKKESVFHPPALDDVRAYCTERKNGIDPETFIDFYTSKGWMVGKNRMKDWKAAVRTWERSRGGAGSQQTPAAPERKMGFYDLSDLVEYPPGSGQYRPSAEVPRD